MGGGAVRGETQLAEIQHFVGPGNGEGQRGGSADLAERVVVLHRVPLVEPEQREADAEHRQAQEEPQEGPARPPAPPWQPPSLYPSDWTSPGEAPAAGARALSLSL